MITNNDVLSIRTGNYVVFNVRTTFGEDTLIYEVTNVDNSTVYLKLKSGVSPITNPYADFTKLDKNSMTFLADEFSGSLDVKHIPSTTNVYVEDSEQGKDLLDTLYA